MNYGVSKKNTPKYLFDLFFNLITTAIAVLFLGKFIFAIISLIIGLISLIAWTFFGLFEETENT